MNRFAKLAVITGAGLIAHQTDRPLLAIEHDTTEVAGKQPMGLWYLFIRYGIGVVTTLISLAWLMSDITPDELKSWQEQEIADEMIAAKTFENGIIASTCVGIGVFTGHLFDDLWRG